MRSASSLAEIAALPDDDVARFDAEARRLVADLHAPRPAVFWTDLLLSAGIGWVAFAVAVASPTWSALSLGAASIAVFAFYRALCFMHEVTHVRPGALQHFEAAWNVLIGVPLLMPSTVYQGVHQDHHKLSTYATAADPEYLPFGTSRAMTVQFAVAAVLIPFFLIVRFVVIVPLELVWPACHRFLAARASALSMNPQYVRSVTPAMSSRMRILHTASFLLWAGAIGLAIAGMLPWRTFVVWYAVTAVASTINSLRTLVAHRYEGSGEPMSRRAQLLDSIDTPGGIWTELWAPVGLRYHALHHYFPGIPYHNLGEAYRRLIGALPKYTDSTGTGLVPGLANLYRRGGTADI